MVEKGRARAYFLVISRTSVRRAFWLATAAIVTCLASPLVLPGWGYLTSPTTSAAVAGKVVVIDPGHGGADPGCVSASGILEKHIDLAVARKLAAQFRRAAMWVVLTRDEDDDTIPPGGVGDSPVRSEKNVNGRPRTDEEWRRTRLEARADVGNSRSADIFLSIHANSFPEPYWHGAQTFHYPGGEEGKKLAVAIQDELIKRQLTPDYRLAKEARFVVLERARMPAALVEVGFLSNPDEAVRLANPAYQEKLAAAIFAGVVNYLAGRK